MPSAGREEGAEPLERGLERRALGGVTDAYRALPARTEGRARRETDSLLHEQPAAEGERIVEAVDAREEVERAGRIGHGDAGDRAERLDAEVAVRGEHLDHLPEFGLALLERRLCRDLGERRGVGDEELVQLGELRPDVRVA